MSIIIKDVFKVHNLIVARALSGEDAITIEMLTDKFDWSYDKASDVLGVFRAIEPTALVVGFDVQCPVCENYMSADSFAAEVNKTGSAAVTCECAAEFKITIDNMDLYFRISNQYAKSREEFV